MKRILLLAAVFGLFSTAGMSVADENNQIRVQCQIFRLTDNPTGRMSIDESIWTTEKTPSRFKNKVSVFSRGSFEFGEDKFEFRNGGCFWNEQEIPITDVNNVKLPSDQIRLLFSPVIEMAEHSPGEFNIRSEQPVQYFEKRKDGLFELKEVKLPMGLDIEITEPEEEEEKGYILLTDIVMTLRTVQTRKKIEGVNLSVGEPVLGEQKYVFFFRVRPGKDYGILIRPERGMGALLIRLRATSMASGTYEKKQAEDKYKK